MGSPEAVILGRCEACRGSAYPNAAMQTGMRYVMGRCVQVYLHVRVMHHAQSDETILTHCCTQTYTSARLVPAPQVTPIVSTNCLSAGEALRLIDQGHMIKNDFVLCSADIVSNMRLAPMLEAHRARRAADKNAIMTLVGLGRHALGDREERCVPGHEPWRS